MNFFCSGCNQHKDFNECCHWRITKEEEMRKYCRSCYSGAVSVPDVFFDAKPEENLADDPLTGKPRVFSSKGEKAAYLKERGIMEAGDRVHGAPIEVSKNQERVRDSKHEVKMTLKHIKEMGIDVRRQAYLKVIKENQKRMEGRKYA